MFPLHCNKCFQRHQPGTAVEFHISSCEHILCKLCVNTTCPLCHRSYKPVVINKDMPPNYAAYFSNTQKMFKNFQKVVKFQLQQEANFSQYIITTLPAMKKKVQKECDALIKVDNKIAGSIQKEKERMEKLKNYLAYRERRLEQPVRMALPQSQRPALNERRRHSAGRGKTTMETPKLTCNRLASVQTPTLSITDSNVEKKSSTDFRM